MVWHHITRRFQVENVRELIRIKEELGKLGGLSNRVDNDKQSLYFINYQEGDYEVRFEYGDRDPSEKFYLSEIEISASNADIIPYVEVIIEKVIGGEER